ncbi:MAG: efflux RND transporter periplasmic adaptor subunit [Bacteroidales bacterium]|jgi:multidrug efflux pump subunit AcrA (membrane-fusion protein)|nr:efflux RND transporter periplasmic adaptor subunit [Bacteroidales bacterium]
MKKTLIISGIVVAVAIIALIVFNRITKQDELAMLYAEATRGKFEILVSTTGELQAENSTEIKGPEGLGGRRMRFRNITIQDLIPEGTVVQKGDYVATLDRSEADNNLKDELDELEVLENDYEMKKLDTTIQLGNLRDDILNLKFNMEEAEITLEQSRYEPPTTIRQNRINLDKAQRAYEQALKNYELEVQQAQADMRDALYELREQRQTVEDMQNVLKEFTVTAPAPGMVIYKREWSGEKRTVGSSISPWDPVVATLPDMSSMISKTYVNEIDISKVSKNQQVRITVDAFPEKRYKGEVISVANIGEQLPNTDAKVFEVIIKLDAVESILRPSMTTGNQIITASFEDVLSIPLECVHATEDSIPYVYHRNGTRQVVVLGESNENKIIVEEGLEAGDQLYLSLPEEPETFKLAGEELIEKIREKERLRREEEEKREKEIKENNERGSRQMTPEMRERLMNMSEEEREQMRSNMQQQRGGGGQGS